MMKSYKQIVKTTLIVLVLIGIVFGVYYFFFTTSNKVEGEANLIDMKLPADLTNIECSLEEVSIQKLEWKDVVSIKGWVYKQHTTGKKREVLLVFKSTHETLIFEIENDNICRPDVTTYFHDEGGFDNHGFELFVPVNLLKDKIYQIGFVVEDETDKYFSLSSKVISVSDGFATVKELESAPVKDIPLSNQVLITLKEPTVLIDYNFENINIADGFLSINGWGLLKGMNADSMNTYILLKKNELIILFSVNVIVRKDVTEYFSQSGLNLDLTGFSAQIPVEKLEKGHYQVGLYILTGDEIGLIFSDKYIDIDK